MRGREININNINNNRALQYPSVKRVTAINQDIAARHERAGITSQENRQSVQIIHGTKTSLGSEGFPDDLLGIKGWHVVESRVHVAGGDAVDADVVFGPFCGEGFAELDDAGFGGVVAGLFLWVVDDGAGHGGYEDDRAWLTGFDHGFADGLGDHEGAVQVDVD